MRHPLMLGYFVLTFAQIAISVNVIAGKYLTSTLSMFLILTIRFAFSTVLLSCALWISKTTIISPHHPDKKLSGHDWFLGILQGLFGATLFNLFFLSGLQHTTAMASGIVGSTLPAMVAISAIWFLNEKLNSAKITALFLAMLGILIINFDHFEGGNTEHTYFGDCLVFLAMLPEAWFSIVSRKLANRITPLGAAFLANVVGTCSFLPIVLLSSTPIVLHDITLAQWGLLGVAGLTSLLFFWGWGWGLSFIPASTAAIFGGVMPVSTALLAIVFLSETLHWYDAVGMLLVLASILIGTGWKWPLHGKKTIASSIVDN